MLAPSQGAPPQPGPLWLVSLDPGVVLDEAGAVISMGREKDLVPLLLAQDQPGSSVASRPAASLKRGSGVLRPLCLRKALIRAHPLGRPLSFFLTRHLEPAHPEAGPLLPHRSPAWGSHSEGTWTPPGFLCRDGPCSWGCGDSHKGLCSNG